MGSDRDLDTVTGTRPTGRRAANKADTLGRSDFICLFETPHNRTITWNHLLRQTSDWEGTLWGKPDWADRPSDKRDEWTTRPRNFEEIQRGLLFWCPLKEGCEVPDGAELICRWYG